jgi:hypothetical protein
MDQFTFGMPQVEAMADRGSDGDMVGQGHSQEKVGEGALQGAAARSVSLA